MEQRSKTTKNCRSEELQGIALSVDPGNSTGWARIDIASEKPLDFGVVDTKSNGDLWVIELAERMASASLLIIEDQHYDKKRENPDSLIKLAAKRGAIEMLWSLISGFPFGDQVAREKATRWQASLGLPVTANSKTRKRAALKQAYFLTGKRDIPQDAADAICQGAAIIRRLKSARMKRRGL